MAAEDQAIAVFGLRENRAADTPLDLRIYDTAAPLHGGHLPMPATDETTVSVHPTAEGDAWLQVMRLQKSGEAFNDVAFGAYRDLLLSAREISGNLVRIWNHIPSVLSREASDIRYHRFNAGRSQAWRKYGPTTKDGQLMLPAATGIGSGEEGLYVRAFMSPDPVIRLQNPSQIPPAQYSNKYGVLPPIFSRASILLKPDRHIIFVSGTASITGEHSTDLADPEAQTHQSLNNIRKLIGRENCRVHGYDRGFTFADLKSMRVYVKRADQFDVVHRIVNTEISCPVTFKRCDICRDELLVEIECICEIAA